VLPARATGAIGEASVNRNSAGNSNAVNRRLLTGAPSDGLRAAV
jgi:hypothetical protein